MIFAQPESGAGQFVITNYTTGAPPASAIRGIWTSPDGSVWTVRTTPSPVINANQSWSYVAYSPSLDLYVASTLGQTASNTDMMTSTDGGVTWTKFSDEFNPGSRGGVTKHIYNNTFKSNRVLVVIGGGYEA